MRQYVWSSVVAGVLAGVTGCGSSDGTVLTDTSVFSRAQPVALDVSQPLSELAFSRAATVPRAARVPSAQELLDWAEAAYPALFPVTPSRPALQTFATYLYRYYPQFDWLLAVNQADGSVVGMVGVSTAGARVVPLGSLSGFACSVFPANCGVATPVVFEKASVAAGASEVSAFMNVCNPAAPRSATTRSTAGVLADLPQLRDMQQALAVSRSSTGGTARTYTSTRPADKTGSCGGRMTYTSYVHTSGTTTATREFINYCTTDSSTGKQQVVNGTMSFVNRANPSPSGPVTTQFTAQSPNGLSFITRTNSGATLTSQTYRFTNYVQTPGVPGGTATQTNPDRIDVEELISTNNLTGKAYRQTGYTMTYFDSANGGQQATLSGRGYRSNGQYYDLTTTSPVITNDDGDYVSGVFTFVGAGGSTTVANIVPGSTLQASVAVGGDAVTGLPACAP
jgi:hypothetical protein